MLKEEEKHKIATNTASTPIYYTPIRLMLRFHDDVHVTSPEV